MIHVTTHCIQRYMQRVMGLGPHHVEESMGVPQRVEAVKRLIRSKVAKATRTVPVKHGLWCSAEGLIFCMDTAGRVTTCFPARASQTSLLERHLAAS